VLVQVCSTWQEAAAAAGIACTKLPKEPFRLGAMECLAALETGGCSFDSYLDSASKALGCSPRQARLVHSAILGGMYPGAPELLAELRLAGIRMGCLSNTNKAHWHEVLTSPAYSPLSQIEMRMPSCAVGLQKPDPALYERFAKEFSLSPESIVFFDDSAENVQAAIACGWKATHVNRADPVSQVRAKLRELGVFPTTAAR
jgi:beta-phosphoglucomutase-like phosphatase (HAD superfamily)